MMLTQSEVDRLYEQALEDFGRVFSEPNRKPIWLSFNLGAVDHKADYYFGVHGATSNSFSFPLAASIGENVVRELIKSWLRDGIVYHGVNRRIQKPPAEG